VNRGHALGIDVLHRRIERAIVEHIRLRRYFRVDQRLGVVLEQPRELAATVANDLSTVHVAHVTCHTCGFERRCIG
jgi:hypothetical protein